ncbi:pilus assembly protein PilP [Chitinilyticum litopenaei]|uniref:pilus assembly protein PilP n=1 Tax=Chitinilyticum litopenaei TaxID=1121276 RepID=UPI0004916148|nr:pilus assembly protein PilP [Chitinilyticum litopenaei]
MKNLRLISYLILPLLLSGCIFGSESDDLQAWMDEQTNSMRGKVEPLPEVKPYEAFSYAAYDLLDPYSLKKMELAKKNSGGPQPDPNRPREVLESFDLEKLRMVGTLQRGKAIEALIKAPDGNLYRVHSGNFMGQNFGRVIAITETEIKLVELVGDSSGDWKEQTTTLPLDEAEQKK